MVIPARDEEKLLGSTVAAARLAGAGTILVIDDGSLDGTAAEALASGADLVRTKRRLGKGQAVEFGLRALFARGIPDDLPVVLLDADLGGTAVRLGPLLEAIEGPKARLAVGVLPRAGNSRGLGLATGLARWGIKRYSGLRTAAPLSGQRAIRACHLRRLLPLWPGFALEVGMTLDALMLGIQMIEIPVDMGHRATGWTPGGIVHRGRQFLDIARCLGRYGMARTRP